MRPCLLALPMLLVGCGDRKPDDSSPGGETSAASPDPGAIRGRVCDPTTRTWLPGALAYANVFDADGRIVDVRSSSSDRQGDWALTDLPGDEEYTVYVEYGGEMLGVGTVWLPSGQDVALPTPTCFDRKDLDVAVVAGDYDDVQRVFDEMGYPAYTLVDGTDAGALAAFLGDEANLEAYDVVVLAGGLVEDGVVYDADATDPLPAQVAANLRTYVEGGGSVYASDWSYDAVERAWPDAIDFLGDDDVPDAAQLGEDGTVVASVTDEALGAFLGVTELPVHYDLPGWPPIVAVEDDATVHLAGTVHFREGPNVYTLASVPLLVSFPDGAGRVAYSTFRVPANADDDVLLTLQYVIHQR